MEQTESEQMQKPSMSSEAICDIIKSAVANYYELNIGIYKLKSRKAEIVKAKQTSAYFIKQLLPKVTLSYIGSKMKYGHCMTLYSINKIKGLIEIDSKTKGEIGKIAQLLKFENLDGINKAIDFDYYYIDLNDCISIKLLGEKAIVLKGFTLQEANEFIKNNPKTMYQAIAIQHQKTNLFLLQNQPKKQ